MTVRIIPRLVFDVVPEGDWTDKTRRVVDASFRALRSVLDAAHGGIRMREQFRCIDCVLDTTSEPFARVSVPGLTRAPLGVFLLRATKQTRGDGVVISAPSVAWDWRGGQLIIASVTNLAAATRYNAVIAVLE